MVSPELLKKNLRIASSFWRKTAGIEFKWTEIEIVEEPDYSDITGMSKLNSVVSKYYINSPVILVVENLDSPSTGGLTSSDRNGFALQRGVYNDITIAHEMGHVLIPRMFSLSLWATHIEGNPNNLMSSGSARENANISSLDELFLCQTQVDAARNKVIERAWEQ